jgi:hypothetical protein
MRVLRSFVDVIGHFFSPGLPACHPDPAKREKDR